MKPKIKLRCLPKDWICQGADTGAYISSDDMFMLIEQFHYERVTWPYIVIGKPTVNPVGTIHKD